MTIDEKKLEEGRKAMEERVTRMDGLTLSVIKGIWAIEQAITDVLAAAHASNVKGFKKRARRCERLIKALRKDLHWKVLWAGYGLRNEVAHNRTPEEIDAKMKRLRAAYMSVLTPEQGKGLERVKDETVAYQACISVAGFLWAECVIKKDAA